MLPKLDFSSAQKKLLDWYDHSKRDLPFRKNKNPYKIWISEVMLQQTRVNAMLPSYEKFITRFPSIEELAKSSESEVLSYWKGLGYYSRAILLRKGAIQIVSQYNGKFPRDIDQILKIPGIGPYTARAILSIAYDQKLAVLDGNVKRVLSRFFLFTGNIKDPKTNKDLQELADSFLNPNRPGDHNQAIMELGATVCGMDPKCEICPLQKSCLGFQKGKQKELPVSQKKEMKLDLEIYFLFFSYKGKILLTKNPKRRFFKKLYSLPFVIYGKNLDKDYQYLEEWISPKDLDLTITKQKHTITHHNLAIGYAEMVLQKLPVIKEDTIWIKKEELENHFPSSIVGKIKRFF